MVLKQTQALVKAEEDEMDEDETPLKRTLRRKRGRGCDNNTSLSEGSSISPKPNEEASNVCFSSVSRVSQFYYIACVYLVLGKTDSA